MPLESPTPQVRKHTARVPVNASKPLPLVVPPIEASRLLRCCLSTLYSLIRRGELDSYTDGKMRRITVASIHNYIDRRLAAGRGNAGVGPTRQRWRA
jgi:excisionase family DNA binding protein